MKKISWIVLFVLLQPAWAENQPSVLFVNVDDWNDWNQVLHDVAGITVCKRSIVVISGDIGQRIHRFEGSRSSPFETRCVLSTRPPLSITINGTTMFSSLDVFLPFAAGSCPTAYLLWNSRTCVLSFAFSSAYSGSLIKFVHSCGSSF